MGSMSYRVVLTDPDQHPPEDPVPMPPQVRLLELPVPEKRSDESKKLPRIRSRGGCTLGRRNKPHLQGCTQSGGDLPEGVQFEPVPPALVPVHGWGAGARQPGQGGKGQPPLFSQVADLGSDGRRRVGHILIIHDKSDS